MNIHEYQAKALLKAYGAPVAAGHVASTPEEAVAAARNLKGESFVVKAQIHAGGRGKGGGIKLVKELEELRGEAERMLGKPLVTPLRVMLALLVLLLALGAFELMVRRPAGIRRAD